MLTTTDRQNKLLADDWLQTAIEYKVECEHELDRRARLGATDLPEPIPHPDHVRIDLRKDLESEQDEGIRKIIRDDIDHKERLLDAIASVCEWEW